MKSSYDSERYHPAAPVVTVTIGNPRDAEKTITIAALVDTGAEATILPPSFIDALGGKPAGECTVLAAGGTRIARCPVCFLELEIAGVKKLKKVIGLREEPILGRDLLNDFRIELDGPRETLTVCVGGATGTASQ